MPSSIWMPTLFYGAAALILLVGWVKYVRALKHRDTFWFFSLTAISLATMSSALAVSSISYAHTIGGFPYYDPLLLRIFRWGFCLSLTAVIFALAGVWRKNALRWYAVALSTITLLFWFGSAMGE
jgi:hypothetical protein